MSTKKKTKKKMTDGLVIGGEEILEGETVHLDLSVARLPTHTKISIPIVVIRGKKPGPRLWLSASIHGDELNGIEIIHRVLDHLEGIDADQSLCGAVIAVPIVNVFGFIHQSRYLPDGRDLNRSFPGSRSGSLASRMARLFMDEVVANCTHGIDLHTATNHRTNLPQIRADLDDEATSAFALSFGAPVTLHAKHRDGSLRDATCRKCMPVLVYEGGEAHRFNADAVEVGVQGVLRAMRFLKMLPDANTSDRERPTCVARSSRWIRARRGGLLRLDVHLGDHVTKGQRLGTVGDPFGGERVIVKATHDGTVVGQAQNPIVYQGDAVVHVAT
jgi:predicted deacylase